MRILLDENLNWRLRRVLPGHQVESVVKIGWAGTKNGQLLRRAVGGGFEVLVTMDRSMSYQQNISEYQIAVVALRATSNILEDTRLLMPRLLAILPSLKAGTLTVLDRNS